jgi:hypothetical protein
MSMNELRYGFQRRLEEVTFAEADERLRRVLTTIASSKEAV